MNFVRFVTILLIFPISYVYEPTAEWPKTLYENSLKCLQLNCLTSFSFTTVKFQLTCITFHCGIPYGVRRQEQIATIWWLPPKARAIICDFIANRIWPINIRPWCKVKTKRKTSKFMQCDTVISVVTEFWEQREALSVSKEQIRKGLSIPLQ